MSDVEYCSFCGKNQHEVVKLISGPRVFICDECVDLCHDLVHNKEDVKVDERLDLTHFEVIKDNLESINLAVGRIASKIATLMRNEK